MCPSTDTNADLLCLCPICVLANLLKVNFLEKLFRLCRKKTHSVLAKIGPTICRIHVTTFDLFRFYTTCCVCVHAKIRCKSKLHQLFVSYFVLDHRFDKVRKCDETKRHTGN